MKVCSHTVVCYFENWIMENAGTNQSWRVTVHVVKKSHLTKGLFR